MKRKGNLFEQVVEWKNLCLAYHKARGGKRQRPDVLQFSDRLNVKLRQMADELQAGTFLVGRFHQFVIHDPKQRIITAPCFPERVLHHAIMNVCEPCFESWLIHDTYACRAGRGREAAIQRAQRFTCREPFFLKLDIRRYFESISHNVLLTRLERLFRDDRLLQLFGQIVTGFHSKPGRGLPIGSLTSQHFANFYLGWFDRFVKQTLRVKGYVRYMDDSLLWGPSAAAMRTALDRCREFVGQELQLEFKQHPYINRSRHGVDFLGCRVFPDHVRLNRRSRMRFARRMTSLEHDYVAGHVNERELQERATSLLAFTQSGGAKSWQMRTAVLQRLPVSGRRPRTG